MKLYLYFHKYCSVYVLDTLAMYDDQSYRVEIKEIVALWDQVQTDVSLQKNKQL